MELDGAAVVGGGSLALSSTCARSGASGPNFDGAAVATTVTAMRAAGLRANVMMCGISR
jgi:3-deoxy-D-arabino-heptulosonate 7-phosphate (DAHP) synthase